MASVFTEKNYHNLVARINQLTNLTQPLWGKMNVAQMLHHCTLAFEMALGTGTIKDNSNLFKRLLFKKMVIGPKPFKRSLPTGKGFIITGEKDFEREKANLLNELERAHRNGPKGKWFNHSLVGPLTGEEWGWLLYKHTNHHLLQFGV